MDEFGGYGNYGRAWNLRQQPYKRGIERVHGQEGAEALPMLPNDECIALDETDSVMWMIRTDSRGYKTVLIPYSLGPYQPKPKVDMNSLDDRLRRLEEMLSGQYSSGGFVRNDESEATAEHANATQKSRNQNPKNT